LNIENGVNTVIGFITLVRDVSVSMESKHFRIINKRQVFNVFLINLYLSKAGSVILARIRVSIAIV